MTLLDGDVVRKHLSSELGFSQEHRDINIRRIGFVASEITKNGGIAICAPIAPYQAVRDEVRAMIAPLGGFVLVAVATSLEVCEARDRKGLYAKARAGILKEFTGISDPYEVPTDAEVVIDTARLSAGGGRRRDRPATWSGKGYPGPSPSGRPVVMARGRDRRRTCRRDRRGLGSLGGAAMLDDRKAAILRVVVEEYIETAQPVGSAMVARLPELAVSSATVRNEMGVLEREGYLVQPHTSAGRIPTDKGYRFFVDSLATPGPARRGPATSRSGSSSPGPTASSSRCCRTPAGCCPT